MLTLLLAALNSELILMLGAKIMRSLVSEMGYTYIYPIVLRARRVFQ